MRRQDSWALLYMILELDPHYRNPYKRLEVLEQQFEFGTCQVLFYLEAYLCYQEKPTLLKKLGKFEMQVLNFATKYRLMTRELALYIANFASQQKRYSENLVPDPGAALCHVQRAHDPEYHLYIADQGK